MIKRPDNQRCKTCKWGTQIDWGSSKSHQYIACGYCYKTGNARPCPPGPGCTIYEKKKVNRQQARLEKLLLAEFEEDEARYE